MCYCSCISWYVRWRRAHAAARSLNLTLLCRGQYPGVSVAIFSVFKCTTLESGVSYLDADARIVCYDARHWRYIGGAIVWLFLVPAGIPAFFLWLLRHFRVPQAAALLTDNAWLRECVKMAWQEQLAQPPEAANATYETITTLHLEALVAFFLHKYSSEQAAEILTGMRPPPMVIEDEDLDELEAAGTPHRSFSDSIRSGAETARDLLSRGLSRVAGLHRAESKRLSLARKAASITSSGDASSEDARARRSFLLATLLCHCRTSGEFALPKLTWEPFDASDLAVLSADPAPDASTHPSGVRCVELPNIVEKAQREISFLYAAYSLQSWYWEVLELVRKLALTSILALIAPGSAGQVVVGLLLAFTMLLATMQLQPYVHPTLNLVAKAAQLNLFLLLLVGVLLKLNIDGEGDAHFFSGIVTALCVVPIGMPFLIHMYLRFVVRALAADITALPACLRIDVLYPLLHCSQGGGLEARSLVRDSAWQ